MITSKAKSILSALIFSAVSFQASAIQFCSDGDTITAISIGDVARSNGTDSGNAIYVTTEKIPASIAVQNTRNLNDDQGMAFLSALQTAMALEFKVQLLDHHNENCNSFSELIMSK